MTPTAVHVIDDDEAVRDSLAVLLETRGFEVATYGSVEAFLDDAPSVTGGCVVTDVQMPAMNGLQLLRAFRRLNACVPVLVVTARSGRALAAEAMAEGARAVIEKPFSPDAFVAAVETAIRDASPRSG